MRKPYRPTIRVGLIIFAVILLCNPNLNLIDVLPDFFAYLLLFLFLSPLTENNPRLSEAREGFLKLMWINLSKIPALILMLMIWSGDSSQKSIITVFALSYAVIETIFALPAFANFFEGIFYLGERYDNKKVLTVPSSFGRVTASMLPRITSIFLLVKATMSTLPEFALISVKEYSGDYGFDGSAIIVSKYYPLFAVIGLVIGFLAGIVWAYYLCRYLYYIGSDGELQAHAERLFEERRDDCIVQYNMRHLSFSLLLILVAVGFQIELIFDDLNILPDTVSALLFLFAMLSLRDFTPKAQYAAWAFGTYAVVSAVSYGFAASFVSKYSYGMISRNTQTASAYRTVIVLSAAETIFAVAALLFLIFVLSDIIGRYVGKNYSGEESFRQKTVTELRRGLRRKCTTSVIVGMVACVAGFVQVFMSQFTEFVSVDLNAGAEHSYLYIPQWEWFWIVPLLLSIAWLLLSLASIGDVRRMIQNKYE